MADEHLDPSQRPAEPLKTVKAGDLVRTLKQPPVGAAPRLTADEQRNRDRAAAELSMIFELRDARAFQWFMAEFFDKPFREASEAYRSPTTDEADMPKVRARYLALKEVKSGILEREINHRRKMDPNDTEIFRLEQQLAQL
jgi:hypothetical protein